MEEVKERDQLILSVVKEGALEFILMLHLGKKIGGTAADSYLLGTYQCHVLLLPLYSILTGTL